MNRKMKNVIMITILIIVCILSYFTMSGAVKSSMPNNAKFEKEVGQTPPDRNNEEFSEEDIPQKPSKEFENGEKPNIENMPEGFENGEKPNMEDMPEGFENAEKPDMENMPEDFKNGNFQKTQIKQNISAIYYILFAVEGLIISSLLIYLIMSKFNSKTLKETLATSKKIIIFIILAIIMTVGLTLGQSILAKNVFATNNMPQIENRQRPRNNTNNTNNSNDTNETTDKESSDETNQVENI